MNSCLALIYARTGENALAITLIERLLRTPGAVDSVELQHDPERSEISLGMGPIALRSRLSETRRRTLTADFRSASAIKSRQHCRDSKTDPPGACTSITTDCHDN